MADWRKRALISGDVIFFEHASSDMAKLSDYVYVWDIDKTYLDTHFESLSGLWRTIMEKAFQKKNVPGTRTLVQALAASRQGGDVKKPFPIYFISASPPQMENKIRTKLELDGVNWYGAFFKDNLKNLKIKRFHKLTQQVGFKLQALLQLRLRLQDNVSQILWGDDSESDATIYSLYSDICAHRLTDHELPEILDSLHVEPARIEFILRLQKEIPKHDPVERIYINLANDTDSDFYMKFGRRTLPTLNTFQAALDLFKDKRISAEQLIRVAEDLLVNYHFTTDELAQSVDDLIQRKVLEGEIIEVIHGLLEEEQLIPRHYRPTGQLRRNLYLRDNPDIWVPEGIDYLNDF
jgi:hypothetical protein